MHLRNNKYTKIQGRIVKYRRRNNNNKLLKNE